MISPHYILPENDNATINKTIVHESPRTSTKGNRCGHHRDLARIFIPPVHHTKYRPPLIEKAKRKIRLLFTSPMGAYLKSSVFYHNDKIIKKGRYRKKRSEVREAICWIGEGLIHTLNLKTMILGWYSKTGEFVNYSLKYFAKITGVSYWQVRRAFNALVDAGYATITPRYEKLADGSKRALNPIIRLTPQLFYDLGIDKDDIKKALYAEDLKDRRSALDEIIEKRKKIDKAQKESNSVAKKKRKKSKPPVEKVELAQSDFKRSTPQAAATFLSKIWEFLPKPKPPS